MQHTKIKTFEDACKIEGIDSQSVYGETDTPDIIAYKKLRVIVHALNEGWQPDWNNSSEYKYTPWFRMGSSSASGFSYVGYGYVHTYTYVAARLCFKTRELAEYAAIQFADIYRDYMTI